MLNMKVFRGRTERRRCKRGNKQRTPRQEMSATKERRHRQKKGHRQHHEVQVDMQNGQDFESYWDGEYTEEWLEEQYQREIEDAYYADMIAYYSAEKTLYYGIGEFW